MNKIDSFTGEFAFLSNFYESPVTYRGVQYQNSEAAFQAQKCADADKRMQFSTLTPSQSKRLGRKVPLRKDWENIKLNEMRSIVKSKFEQNSFIRKKLLNTGDIYLEEGNTWGDRIWGTVDGVGQNCLGKILMEVRAEFAKSENAV